MKLPSVNGRILDNYNKKFEINPLNIKTSVISVTSYLVNPSEIPLTQAIHLGYSNPPTKLYPLDTITLKYTFSYLPKVNLENENVIYNFNSIFYNSIITVNCFFGLSDIKFGGGKGVGGLQL